MNSQQKWFAWCPKSRPWAEYVFYHHHQLSIPMHCRRSAGCWWIYSAISYSGCNCNKNSVLICNQETIWLDQFKNTLQETLLLKVNFGCTEHKISRLTKIHLISIFVSENILLITSMQWPLQNFLLYQIYLFKIASIIMNLKQCISSFLTQNYNDTWIVAITEYSLIKIPCICSWDMAILEIVKIRAFQYHLLGIMHPTLLSNKLNQ